MHLNVSTRAPIARDTESDFMIPILVDVLAEAVFEDEAAFENTSHRDSVHEIEEEDSYFSNSENRVSPYELNTGVYGFSPADFTVGRVWAERFEVFLADQAGYALPLIADEVSSLWEEIICTLMRGGGFEFKQELGIRDFVTDIVVIHQLLLHPEVPDRLSAIAASIEAISHMNSLVVILHDQSGSHHLQDWELRDLGFKKVARSPLLLRDNHFRYPFSDQFPNGRRVEFHATLEHEQWINEHWNKLLVDNPRSEW